MTREEATIQALRGHIEALSNEPCEDAISREAAIDAINELHDKPNAWLDLAVDAIDKLPSAQPERQWIPCSERLPEEDELVLITIEWVNSKPKYTLQIAKYFDDKWTDKYGVDVMDYYEMPKVIAWMPLPEAYKENKE